MKKKTYLEFNRGGGRKKGEWEGTKEEEGTGGRSKQRDHGRGRGKKGEGEGRKKEEEEEVGEKEEEERKKKETREREEEKVDMLGSGESGERGSGMLGKEKVIVYTFMFECLKHTRIRFSSLS